MASLRGLRVLSFGVQHEPGPIASVLGTAGAELFEPKGLAEAEALLLQPQRFDVVIMGVHEGAFLAWLRASTAAMPKVIGVRPEHELGEGAEGFDRVLRGSALPQEIIDAVAELGSPAP